MAATLSISLRMTLIGQTPRPAELRAQDHGLQGKRCVDAGIEEAFQRAVADGLAAQFANPLQPPCIAEKDEEHG